MGLTFVPTPLGNLRDITLRALDVLRESSLIVAEDTRVTRRLLHAHGIVKKPIWSYREQNAVATTAAILARARNELVAVMSDAGTPGISDPGRELIVAARAAGVSVDVLPGAVAFVGAAVLSGFMLSDLRFNGFLPRASRERSETFSAALESGATTIWYEAPHRILASLDALAGLEPRAEVFVLREWTKLHEQHIFGTPGEVKAALGERARGEIVLVLAGRTRKAPSEASAGRDLESAIDAELAAGRSAAAAAKTLAREFGADRGELYDRIAQRKRVRSGKPVAER